MIVNTFIGCSVYIITNISLLYSSHLLVRRFASDSPASVRLVATGTCYYAFIVLIVQALSPFHAISKTGVTLVCLALGGVFHVLWGDRRDIRAELDPLRQWVRDGLASRWSVLIIICGFMVLLSFSRALLMPPLAWDCLTYHLTFAALWIKKGTIFLFRAPDQIISCGHMPINGEIFAAWLLLPFHSDLLVNTMNFPITFLGGVACYAIGKELGLPRRDAGWLPLLICFAPVVYDLITTSYVDNALFAFCTAAVLFTLRYLVRERVRDCLFGIIAAGIVVGLKYNGIIVAAIIFMAIAVKIAASKAVCGFYRKAGICFLCALLIMALGGRRYIINTIETANPLYPFPVKIFNHEIIEGWSELEYLEEWLNEYEEENQLSQMSTWEREYRKFNYSQITPGPKFAFFLLMALAGLLIRPRFALKKSWYFCMACWILPIFFYYSDTSTAVAKRGLWIDGSARYLTAAIALFTIQGFATLRQFSRFFTKITVMLVAFITLDFIHINSGHLWEVEVLYPILAILIPAAVILVDAARDTCYLLSSKKPLFGLPGSRRGATVNVKGLAVVTLCCAAFLGGCVVLQTYRDSTRYFYYRNHSDLGPIPRNFIDGWDFLDQTNNTRVVALTAGYKLPNHQWFFYPLLGRRLQNDIVYVSARHKWEIPTWVDGGLLRGTDPEVWFYNLRMNKVDYVFVQEPWPVELRWMQAHGDDFELVFSAPMFRIYRCTGTEQ